MRYRIMTAFMVLSLLILSVGCASNTAVQEEDQADTRMEGSYIDAIQWDGATYLNSGKTVDDDQIETMLGEIQFKLEGSGKDADYQMKDGDAVMLEVGTMVYAVTGTENIAVKGDSGWMVYEKMK